MKNPAILLYVLVLICSPALSRPARNRVPLLPIQDARSVLVLRNQNPTTLASSHSEKSTTLLGLELATLGVGKNSNNDIFGLELLYGFRGLIHFSLSRSFILRPSLGYFTRSQGTETTGVTQHLAEASLAGYFIPNPDGNLKGLFGMVSVIELHLSRLSAPANAVNTPLSLQYRLGPSLGLLYPLKNYFLSVELQGGIAISDQIKPFSGLGLGFGLQL